MSREGSPSGGETPERPVRERFKKTTIDGTPGENCDNSTEIMENEDHKGGSKTSNNLSQDSISESNDSEERGRVRRKRSHEELGDDDDNAKHEYNGDNTSHHRKKSRDAEDGRADHEESSSASSHPDCDGESSTAIESKDLEKPDSTDKATTSRPETPQADTGKSLSSEVEGQRSPLNKRNRDKFDQDNRSSDGMPTVSQVLENSTGEKTRNSAPAVQEQGGISEPESKRKKDDSEAESNSGATKLPSNSGFANASSVSSFASLGTGKLNSASPQTSPSAFAASGFAALANSSQSPFGSFSALTASPSSSGFGPPLQTSQPVDKSTPSGFAALGAKSQSPFATSGFGSLSSGVKSVFANSSGPLKSFAAPAGSATFGSSKKQAKPFGVPETDEEEDDDGGEDDGDEPERLEDDDQPQDSRFYEQTVETGEEDETTLFQARAKLFVNIDKAWKERGVGMFKVNVKKQQENSDEDEEKVESGAKREKPTARFIMRADGSHRIVINSNITKEITIDDPAKGPPKGKNAIFLGFFDGKPHTVLAKFRSPALTLELHETVKEIQQEM